MASTKAGIRAHIGVEISCEDGARYPLLVKNRTGDLAEILPETATSFFYLSGGPTRLNFEKNTEGKITGILYKDDRHEEHWTRE